MPARPRAARIFLRVLAALTLALGGLSLFYPLLRGSPLAIGLGAVAGAIYIAIGLGLWRGRSGALVTVTFFFTLGGASQLAIAAATRDLTLLGTGTLNALLAAGVIWAGRQLPEAPEDAPAPA